MDISVSVKQNTDVDSVNGVLKAASKNYLTNILSVSEKPLVSCDFNHDPRSAIVDLSQTRVAGAKLVKLLVWFDNEWAYANRMLDVAQYLSRKSNETQPEKGS